MSVADPLRKWLLAGSNATWHVHRSEPWRSLTFEGEKHEISLRIHDEELPIMEAHLEEDEWEGDGSLLAEAKIASRGEPDANGIRLITIEAVTVRQ